MQHNNTLQGKTEFEKLVEILTIIQTFSQTVTTFPQ